MLRTDASVARKTLNFAVAVAVCVAVATAARHRVPTGADRIREDVRYLASAELAGRGTGTPEIDKAASYIAAQFQRAGLRPLSEGYRQNFPVTAGAALGERNSLSCTACGDVTAFELRKDFTPINSSASGEITAPLVFAGYGADAPECGYNDYAGLDVRGRIVLLLRHEPQEYERESPFEGRIYTEHSQTFRKALTAKEHGAAAVLMVNDTAAHSAGDTLESFTALAAPGSTGLLSAHVSSGVVRRWFTLVGKDFEEEQRQIDRELRPRSFSFPSEMKVTLRTDVQSSQKLASNVVGYLPGETSEYVIVGAHYDHLGKGEQFSMAPDQMGTIHPGADDNASGTSAVLELSRILSAQPRMRRGVLFIAFAGEEVGLLGSSWYTSHPLLPLKDAVAMINLDMVGRLRDRKLTVGASNSGENLKAIVELAARGKPVQLEMGDDAVYGSSDHTTFRARQIPVLFFFTGLHSDYHRPSDTAERIDVKALGQVVDVAAEVTMRLAQQPERIRFAFPPAREIKSRESASGER